MPPNEHSWEAWRHAVLQKLEILEKSHEHLEEDMHVLRDMLIETVGRSGKNGRMGNLEDRVGRSENASRTRLLMTGTAGGGFLVGIVELLKLLA